MKKVFNIIIDLLIGFIYLKVMGLVSEIDGFSMAIGSILILIWNLLDELRGE